MALLINFIPQGNSPNLINLNLNIFYDGHFPFIIIKIITIHLRLTSSNNTKVKGIMGES